MFGEQAEEEGIKKNEKNTALTTPQSRFSERQRAMIYKRERADKPRNGMEQSRESLRLLKTARPVSLDDAAPEGTKGKSTWDGELRDKSRPRGSL